MATRTGNAAPRQGADPEPHGSEEAPAPKASPVRERWEVRRIADPDEHGDDAGNDGESADAPAEAKERRQDDRDKQDDGRKESKQDGEADPATARRKKRRRWLIAGIVGLIVLAAAGWYAWHYFTVGRYMVETDDAYTQADNVAISPQVAGYISELNVTDNQRVRKGDVIARIDDRQYRAQVDQAKADLAAAVANVHNVEAQVALQQATIAQAEADVGSAQASVTFAEQEQQRYAQLVKTGAGTVQRVQQTEAQLREQRAALVKAQANLEAAKKQLDVLQTQKEQADAQVQRSQAALEQAQVNLGYTTITAPADGETGDRSVRLGQYVQPGTRLLTLVPMQDVYVVANYKETQLDRMHRGQAVDITVDAYPGVTIHGTLDSLAPGSGSQFSLLPPENATGNFTKIVQRVPVKILLDRSDGNPLAGRIRPGLSVIPTVNTLDTKGEKLDQRPSQEGLPPPSQQLPSSGGQSAAAAGAGSGETR